MNHLWSNFSPQYNGTKTGKERSSFGSVFGNFSGKMEHEKYKNHQSNVASGPTQGLKLHETKEKHDVYLQ